MIQHRGRFIQWIRDMEIRKNVTLLKEHVHTIDECNSTGINLWACPGVEVLEYGIIRHVEMRDRSATGCHGQGN